MKRFHSTRKVLIAFCLFISPVLFIACGTSMQIIEENDVVYSTKRISLNYNLRMDYFRSPISMIRQSIVKEINQYKDITYTVFDQISMSSTSFNLQQKVYLIVDNEVFTMTLNKIESEISENISEDKAEILTADSTTVSVVTGYSVNNTKNIRFSYNLPKEAINKIRQTNYVIFRYYAGPSMIDARLEGERLNLVKELINRE